MELTSNEKEDHEKYKKFLALVNRDKLEEQLETAKSDLAGLRRSLTGEICPYAMEGHSKAKDESDDRSAYMEFKLSKLQAKSEKVSKEKVELEAQLDNRKKELQEKQKQICDLQEKLREMTYMKSQLDDKSTKLGISNKERDKLEREVASTRAEVAGLKRTLDLERQERRDLETRALALIKDAKRKWENAEKEKVAQLNKHIEAQTVRITELCTSNNEMSSRLQRTECELDTTNAELHKLKVLQMQYKDSLAKTRELSRQSAQGVETKLEEISNRAHNQLAELRKKLDFEIARNTDLEGKLRNEQDSNHCRQSRQHVAFELVQNELKDCQEQLRSLQATIPARDEEIEVLRKQLQDRSKQLELAMISEQTVCTMQEQFERLQLENTQLKEQLEATKADLNGTVINLERSETMALNLEKITQDKTTLQRRLQESLEKEEEHLRKVGELEELLRRLERSVTDLEAENNGLKKAAVETPRPSTESKQDLIGKIAHLKEQLRRLEQQLETSRENMAAERQIAKQAQMSLWKKEKELSDANLDKRIATRESKRAEDKVKALQAENRKLTEMLQNKTREDEEKSKKLLKELDSAKVSLADVTKEASRNKLQADSAQRALTQSNKQIEELQSASASLRREMDAARKQMRTSQDRADSVNAENKRLIQAASAWNEEKNEFQAKIEKLQQEINSFEINIELLKETSTILEEQLTDYERLTSDHETRENMLIQDKMKLQKEVESVEAKLREARAAQNEEKTLRLMAERNIGRLESETSDIESERNSLIVQRDEYKKLSQELTAQVENLSAKCGELECDLSETSRALEMAKEDARLVKEESSEYLTRLHDLKESHFNLNCDLQISLEQGQKYEMRIAELENVFKDMQHFYEKAEVKAESTRQQQTKLIDYLQMKLEECGKKKKTMCDKILGTKQKENVPPSGTGMPVGYRELENQLTKERAKVKTLTEQLLSLKAMHTSASAPSSPSSPQMKKSYTYPVEAGLDPLTSRLSPQRIGHNIPHRFNVDLPMRAGKCYTCADSIQFGKRAAICSECHIMTHPKCYLSVPDTCGLPGTMAKQLPKSWDTNDERLTSTEGSVQTLSIDQPDKPDVPSTTARIDNNSVAIESWVKVPGRLKSCWERKYLRLEGSCLCTYEHQPSSGMSPTNRLDLNEKNGFVVCENVQQPEVLGTTKSDLPYVFRLESNSSTTCWPTSRIDIMALNQTDKKNWLKALRSITSQNSSGKAIKNEKYHTVLKLEKHQLDLNCTVHLTGEEVLLLGAEEGLFSYCGVKSRTLTPIRGVKKIHQLTLHPHLDLALMIAGENRQLVWCSLRQLKCNALAAECSRPAISTKAVLNSSESCHLYQVEGHTLFAATATHILLLKWTIEEDSGKFIETSSIKTTEPCSCAIFVKNALIVGIDKFLKIDLRTYQIDDFPEEDDNSVKVTILGMARHEIFPLCVLNVSSTIESVELLLCYNEFGVFVNERGQRTRAVDPTWNHLPFTFAFRKPYLFVIYFSSVEIIRLDSNAYTSTSKGQERALIDLSSLRYSGVTDSKGIYVTTVNSFFELLRIEGPDNITDLNGSLNSLNTLARDDDSSSEFSFTSSIMEALDGPGKKVHFAGVPKY